jgi:hypothetical protein
VVDINPFVIAREMLVDLFSQVFVVGVVMLVPSSEIGVMVELGDFTVEGVVSVVVDMVDTINVIDEVCCTPSLSIHFYVHISILT